MTTSHTTTPTTPTTPLTPFMRRLLLTALVLGAAAVTACSTTEGFGKDVENLGDNIEDSAARNK